MEDPDWQTAALQMLHQVGPSLPELAEQLGWPPPQAIIDRWCKQLDDAGVQLVNLGLMVRLASLADFQVDPAGQLYWMMLPQRIEQSQASPPRELLTDSQLQPHGELWELITAVDSSQLIEQLKQKLRCGADGIAADGIAASTALSNDSRATPELHEPYDKLHEPNDTRPRVTEHNVIAIKRTRVSRSKFFLTVAPFVAVTIAGTSWWIFSQSTADTTTITTGPLPKVAVKLPVSKIDQEDTSDTSSDLERFEAILLDVGTFDQTLDLEATGLLPLAPQVAPPSDSQTATTDDVAPQPSAPQDLPVADSAHAFVSLPARTDTTEFSLGTLAAAELNHWETMPPSLEFPTTAAWVLIANDAHSKLVAPAANPVAESAVARFFVPQADASSGELRFQWLDTAASEARTETLRNGRFVNGDHCIWLREPQVQPLLRWQFQTATEQHSWPLASLPDSRKTMWTLTHRVDAAAKADLAAAASNDEPANTKGDLFASQFAKPLFIQWLNPVSEQQSRNVRGLLEIRLTEDDPVAVRIRVDAKLDRQITVTTLAAASIGVQNGWQEIQWQMLDAARINTTQWQENAELLLEQIRQQIRVAATSEQKSVLRDRRSLLEQSLENADTALQGLQRLHSLLLRIEQEVGLQMRLEVKWPDGKQLIFAITNSP